MKNSLWRKAWALAALCLINVSVLACDVGEVEAQPLMLPITRLPQIIAADRVDVLRANSDPMVPAPVKIDDYPGMEFTWRAEITDTLLEKGDTPPAIAHLKLMPLPRDPFSSAKTGFMEVHNPSDIRLRYAVILVDGQTYCYTTVHVRVTDMSVFCRVD
jgi:hypothetical protein